jgi:hypothetical protein
LRHLGEVADPNVDVVAACGQRMHAGVAHQAYHALRSEKYAREECGG